MKISQIANWVDALNNFINISKMAEIRPEDLVHLIELDLELEEPISYVYRLFSKPKETTEESTEETTTITTTTIPVTTTTDIPIEEIIVEEIPVEEIPIEEETTEEEKEVVEDTATSTTDVDTSITDEVKEAGSTPSEEIWKVHPKMKEYRLSPEGRVQKQDKSGYWYDVLVAKRGGYMIFHNHQLARCMLETYDSVRDRCFNPLYKDGNKENCHIDNLSWSGHRNTCQTDADIERACKLILKYADKPQPLIINKLADINIGRTCYLSIIKGNYKNISDKYFTVKGKKIIPNSDIVSDVVEEKKVEEKEPIALPTEQAGIPIDLIDLIAFTKDSGLIKKNFPEKPTQSDKYALVLSYVNEGKKTTVEIQKAIHKDFGKRIYISNNDIEKVLSKSVYTKICDKIF